MALKTNTDHTGLKGGTPKNASNPGHQTHQSFAEASKFDPSGSKGNQNSATLGLKGSGTRSASRTVSSVRAPELALGRSTDPQQK